MQIESLKKISEKEFEDLGNNSYDSHQVLNVNITNHEESTFFELSLNTLEKSYQKHWETTSEEIAEFNKAIKMGHSFGAYENNRLIGIAICEEQEWNNTLYLLQVLVSQNDRGKGVGKLLIEKIIGHAKNKNLRLIELETQNTNVPAIKFYKKQGFKITGLKAKLYHEEINEIALYMTYDV